MSTIMDEEKETDPQLDDSIGQLGIAEFQVNKLHRILASRLDRSNPLAFSKRSSTHTFESEGRVYRITVEVDAYNTAEKSITRAFGRALKSPAFIITSTLCLAIICVLAFVSPYWGSSLLGPFSDRELDTLDSQYSLILDRCAAFINDDRPNPRSFGALYSTCNKAIIQLQGFCEEHHIATCEDERLKLYLARNKLGGDA
jgi:hypothetical protein